MSKGTEFASPFDRAKRGEIGGRQNDATTLQHDNATASQHDNATALKRDDAMASQRDGAEQEKSAHTSLYMSTALLRWLRRDALDRGLTMNKLVVQLITAYRERQEGSQS
jgi:hypothetical protein